MAHVYAAKIYCGLLIQLWLHVLKYMPRSFNDSVSSKRTT